MKSVVYTLLLVGLLLNAGAFASDNRAYLRGKAKEANITVLTKNQAWPVRHATTLEPCALGGCSDV
jgi:hypothetical protein